MSIQSANYNTDLDGKNISIHIVYTDDLEIDVPIDGSTWRNYELNAWIENGGIVAPASQL